MFARPGVVVAGSGADYPERARAAGAKTVYWDMYLSSRVGTPMKPADAAGLPAKAQRVFDFALLSAGCADPVIVMNELFGASTPTPWTPTTARYRANVLAWARLLKEKGGHPLLLVSSEPFTGGDAGVWWRELAEVADIALEKYFNAPAIHKAGPELGSRRMRTSMRDSLAKLVSVGVPPAQLGVVMAFQTRRGSGGREGLEPAGAWFEVAKLQALAAKHIAREFRLGYVVSWGGASSTSRRATRTSSAPAASGSGRAARRCAVRRSARALRPRSRRRADRPPRGVRCALGAATITTNEIASLARVTRDADAALTILFARLVQQQATAIGPGDVRAAERVIVQRRFGGSRREQYLGASARGRQSRARARRDRRRAETGSAAPQAARDHPASGRDGRVRGDVRLGAAPRHSRHGHGAGRDPATPLGALGRARPAGDRARTPARRARRALRVLGRAAAGACVG